MRSRMPKLGDLIKVTTVMDGVHPVGIVLRVVEEEECQPRHVWCLYMDGDYEVLDFGVDLEVLSERG